jgi:alpha-L-fucosidase
MRQKNIDTGKIMGRNANYDTGKHNELWNKYVKFVHNQIDEICSQKPDILWLDAGWCGIKHEDLQMDKLAQIARKHKSDMLLVDRTMGGKYENYVTPERGFPKTKKDAPKQIWEANFPLGDNWGYVGENDNWKSAKYVKNSLEHINKLGGNLLIGIGPKYNGEITKIEQNILKKLNN